MERDEQEVFALLTHLDHPPPRVSLDAILARAAQSRWSGPWRWAAAILLTTTLAGVAYAAPGSPLGRWIARAVERVMPSPSPRRVPPQAPRPADAGIALVPGSRMAIVFTRAQPSGTARVRLGEGSEVVIRATSDAVRFTSETDRVVIETGADAPDFEIVVPRNAAKLEVLVGERRVFLKDGSRITAPDSVPGGYVLPLNSD